LHLPQRLAIKSGLRVGNVFVVVDPPRSCWAPTA
jgi:cobalamin biosynthesis Mg chelatase CobN